MVTSVDLQGIFSALVTPMRPDETLRLEALGQLVQHQLDAGVEGFYCCGSSGEALLLSLEERAEVVRTVVEEVAGRVPVIAHVGTLRTADAIGLARDAQAAGATAVSLIPPYYYSFRPEEVTGYYEAVLRECDLPVILYNIPNFTGFAFDQDSAGRLLSHPRVIGIKHTSQDMYLLERLRHAHPDKVYFNGFDESFLAGLAAGANAAVGTTVNVQAPRFLRLRDCLARGDLAQAQQIQHQINDVVEVLLSHGIFPSVKYLAGLQGVDCGPCRAPFQPLDAQGRAAVEAIHRQLQTETHSVEDSSRDTG